LILITVEDANDHAPTFYDDTVKVTVLENHPVGVPIYELTAVDEDRGVNADISYGLTPGSELMYGQLFVVNRETGTISLR